MALDRDGPDVRDCRILLRCRIERRVGLVDATHGDLCDTRGELTTPIILKHDGKDCEVGMKAIVRSGRHDGRAVAAFTVAEASGLPGLIWW